MSDKNLNEWLFADMEDLIDCDYSDESDDENRPTDNEIIKALEDEVKSAEYVDSYYCNGVDLTLIKSSIDLINRQKSEIERLKGISVSSSKDSMDFCGVLCNYTEELINRQKTEIDELKHEREVLIEDIHHSADKINEQLEEIEKLERTISYLECVCESTPDKVRTEAIKEFTKELKDRIVNFPSVYPIESATLAFLNGSSHRQLEILEIIENLIKEMIGDTE